VTGIKESKLFGGMLAAELQRLEQTTQMRSFRAGQVVFKEGDAGDGLYLVIEGLVQISAILTGGERKVLTRIGPNDFFGEMAVLDNSPRSATAIAEQDTSTWFLPSEELLPILERSPKIAVSLLREFSQRMRDFNKLYVQELLQAERLSLVGRFTRSILHDFKGPLTVISMSSELASADDATAEDRKTCNLRIRKQIDRMSNMINELLEFSRGGTSTMLLSTGDYGAFVTQLLEEIRLEAAGRKVTVECENPPPQVSLPFDPRRLTNVFYNLIHNAIEAMPGGGKVILRFKVADDAVTTEIEDTGKGIAPEIAGKLFQPFATFGKAQGTGLGLSICKRIIEDHKGVIQAISRPGRGAIFAFSLPRKVA
jgi:signal transduction histidine kinase